MISEAEKLAPDFDIPKLDCSIEGGAKQRYRCAIPSDVSEHLIHIISHLVCKGEKVTSCKWTPHLASTSCWLGLLDPGPVGLHLMV